MPDREDYYEILGVDPYASQEEIKKARDENAFIYHEDRMRGLRKSVRLRAVEKMKRVNRAYATLGDPQKREQYHAEWLRGKGGAMTPSVSHRLARPKPVANPAYIRFDNVPAKTVNTSSFIIRNDGGDYSEIWFSAPKSWVEIAHYTSLCDYDELPLRVEIKAEGKDWGKTYSETIIVRLDNEETLVRIVLQTRTGPAAGKDRAYVNKRTHTSVRPIPLSRVRQVGRVPHPSSRHHPPYEVKSTPSSTSPSLVRLYRRIVSAAQRQMLRF